MCRTHPPVLDLFCGGENVRPGEMICFVVRWALPRRGVMHTAAYPRARVCVLYVGLIVRLLCLRVLREYHGAGRPCTHYITLVHFSPSNIFTVFCLQREGTQAAATGPIQYTQHLR